MGENTDLLFVYGTLMRGLWNHALVAGCEFLGTAWTLDEHTLYSAGIPYLTVSEPRHRVLGELYRVSQDDLLEIDCLEGHPDHYYRMFLPVSMITPTPASRLHIGETILAQSYAWLHPLPEDATLVPSGDFRSIQMP